MTEFLRQFLSQPGMLAGTLLVSVPILIYLINRQRYKRRKWAAMEFLLRALQRNRRRIRLENLLLLLIRCAIITLLAFAMARPFIRDRVLDSSSSQPENWIFALDTSYSMGLREGNRSLFETAREALTNIIKVLVKSGDRVAVVTMDASPRVVTPPRQMTDSSRGNILETIAELEPGYRAVNVSASLRTVLEVAREFEASPGSSVALSGKKLVLFSDFQRKDWLRGGDTEGDDLAPRDPIVNELLREMKESGILLSRADLKGSDRNLTLLDLSLSPPIASRDVWVNFEATVSNFGKEDFDVVKIRFVVNGQEERTHVARVPAGATVTRSLPYPFTTAGYHSVMAEVSGDDLTADNRRYLAVHVRESADVLVVNGEPGSEPLERETLFLELALMPESSDEFRRTPYRPVPTTVDQLLAESPELQQYVAVILANVSAADLPGTFLDELRRYVRDGGALMVFVGKNVIPEEYNETFGAGAQPLLPLRMVDQRTHDSTILHTRFVDSRHPVARYFVERSDFTALGKPGIEFRRFIRIEEPREGSDVALLLRFSDPEESLAAFDHSCGEGRVLWVASTADREWNDFAWYPDFIPFLHESIPYLVRYGEGRLNLSLGEPFRQVFEAYDSLDSPRIIPPRVEEADRAGIPTHVPKELFRVASENRFYMVHEETIYPGFYEIRFKRVSDAGDSSWERRQVFAVNLDPTEGDLRSLSAEELESYFPDFDAEVFDAEQRVKEITMQKSAASGTELWRQVLWLVLALLVAESVLAFLFGRSLR